MLTTRRACRVDNVAFGFRYPPYKVRILLPLYPFPVLPPRLPPSSSRIPPAANLPHFRQPNYKKHIKAISGALPPRPGQGTTAAAAAKRWAFWVLFALVGAGSVVLTRARGQLKA